MLIVFSGLPGVGKTGIAKELARQLDATYLRIDSIEQAVRDSGGVSRELDEAGYRVAYTVAEDNLRLGRTVIADCVNPLQLTRDAWRSVAEKVSAKVAEVEITCSDPNEHRQRVEMRAADISGLRLPSWDEVLQREYEPWDRDRIVIDTRGKTVADGVKALRAALA